MGKTLVFLLVHGIGAQRPELHKQFLQSVEQAVARELGWILSAAGSAASVSLEQLLSQLKFKRADWSGLFTDQEHNWLTTLYWHQPKGLRHTLYVVRIALYVAWCLAAMLAIYGLMWYRLAGLAGAGGEAHHLLLCCLKWCIVVLACIAAFMLIWWLLFKYPAPWGRTYALLRGIEATKISDVFLYQGREGRRQIFRKVLAELRPFIAGAQAPPPPPSAPGSPADDPRVKVILAGHSLGSVVVYDMLLACRAYAAQVAGESWPKPALRRAIESLAESDPDAAPDGEREPEPEHVHHLIDLEEMLKSIAPVGMITFGSPISLFLFRKPGILTDPRNVNYKPRDLWRYICPSEYRQTGDWGGVSWRWQNFWHTADVVAHRMEPLFNAGFPLAARSPERRFVQDIRLRCCVGDPIDAHSKYWENEATIRLIGRQVAATLCEMNGIPLPDKWQPVSNHSLCYW